MPLLWVLELKSLITSFQLDANLKLLEKTQPKNLLTHLFCDSVKKEQLNKLSTFCED